MKDLIDKLSSYNLFNNLLPGVVFVAIASNLTEYNLIQKDILIGVFLYYFVGVVISRIGSIIVEPILKFINFVKFSKYSDYINASKNDELIKTLLEVNNMYRTLLSLFLCLALLKAFEILTISIPTLANYAIETTTLFLFILFAFSYRKQSNYICQRVNNATNKTKEL
ncbi:hypothetical protein [Glaciecola sp. MF2-115]|uniref:hypothetical protein n=1 Tax=Glaciecola sp. MF2-115 TaxID=3384827 RepID=UPI0039A135A2